MALKNKFIFIAVILTLGIIIYSFGKGIQQNSATSSHEKVEIIRKYNLTSDVIETSGLIYFNNLVWTFNDSGGEAELFAYALPDTSLAKRATLWNAYNFDWEDITQDSTHVYAGDMGNNFGNRDNLCIYRINKEILMKHRNTAPKAEKISFTYPGYKPVSLLSFTRSSFDCEAITWYNDSIYLFTKDWITYNTTVYCIPATPGKYIARKIRTFNSDCLITAADFAGGKLFLLGYRNNKASLFVFTSFDDFLNGKETFERIELYALGGAQTEGLAIKNDSTLYISAEGGRSMPPRLWEMKLKSN
ncbi:MAG TPA: hypothetical protein VHO72_17385 [Bacteroidales bacterium]|nr:hypothetical protein [Bacteroidales bacterium]